MQYSMYDKNLVDKANAKNYNANSFLSLLLPLLQNQTN